MMVEVLIQPIQMEWPEILMFSNVKTIIFFKIILIAIKLWRPAKKVNKLKENALNAKMDFYYKKTHVIKLFQDAKPKKRKNVLNAAVENS